MSSAQMKEKTTQKSDEIEIKWKERCKWKIKIFVNEQVRINIKNVIN